MTPEPESRDIHVSAAVIYDHLGRLLLVRKAGTSAFMQPGGKPEAGETGAQTLSREIDEELGLKVAAADLEPLGSFMANAANEPGHLVIAEVFAVDIGGQHPRVAAEIEELRWVSRMDAAGLDIAPLARQFFVPQA